MEKLTTLGDGKPAAAKVTLTPEEMVAELEQLRKEFNALDATEQEKGVVRLTGDFGGTADHPTVPALDEIEDLRAKRAKLLEDKRETLAKSDTTDREEMAAELERLREEARAGIEARRTEIAAEVEGARVAAEEDAREEREEIARQVKKAQLTAENTARKERDKLAAQLEESSDVEKARVNWRLSGHDDHFTELNHRVSECAESLKQQSTAIATLRYETQSGFAEVEGAAVARSLEAIKKAQTADEKAQELANAAKAESRRLNYQLATAIVVALIAAFATIVAVLL